MTEQLVAQIFLLIYLPSLIYAWIVSRDEAIPARIFLLVVIPFMMPILGLILAGGIVIIIVVIMIALGAPL